MSIVFNKFALFYLTDLSNLIMRIRDKRLISESP